MTSSEKFGFWAGILWALKMPLGHLVDLFWRWKSVLVFLWAGLIAVSPLIVAGLLAYTEAMIRIWPVEILTLAGMFIFPKFMAANYRELGMLLITTTVIGLVLSVAAIILVKLKPLKEVGDTNEVK